MKIFINIYVFVVGMIFGSFFNVCIFRIPKNQSILNPPSHCPNCKTRLKPKDLVPILSYLLSGKKCRYCNIKKNIKKICFSRIINRYIVFTRI